MKAISYKSYKGAWINNAFPHLEEPLSGAEAKKLLAKGGLFVRNIYNFDQPSESSFWFVIKDHFGAMEELSSNTRNQVRKSFRMLDFRRLHKKEMIKSAYPVYYSSFRIYGKTSVPMSENNFNQMIENQNENTQFWGAFLKGTDRLIAYGMNFVNEDMCDYSTLKADPDYLKSCYPYYGLIYTMNEYYLSEKRLKYVCDGARTISNHSDIQDFLIRKFKFRRAYCALKIFYQPWMRIVISCLYPFRGLIPIRRVKNLLQMEQYHREQAENEKR